jgi:hypothetical protein
MPSHGWPWQFHEHPDVVVRDGPADGNSVVGQRFRMDGQLLFTAASRDRDKKLAGMEAIA